MNRSAFIVGQPVLRKPLYPLPYELKGRLRFIFQRYQIQKAWIFGSFARGEASRHSDIDLLLVQKTERRFLDRYDGLLFELNLAIPERALDVLIYTPEELQNIAGRSFISQALKEGVSIYESDQESL